MREKPLTEFMGSKKVAKEHGEKPAESKGLKGPWELPEGWKWVRLGDVAINIMGGTPKTSISEYWENGTIPWITAANIDDKTQYVISSEKKITKLGLRNSNTKIVPIGTILLVTTGATAGKLAIAGANLAINQQITALIPKKSVVTSKYLYYTLKRMREILIPKKSRGATFIHINQKSVQRFIIPLPPLHEQKRIVAKLDELNERITEARKLAEEAREEAEKLMASALHEVFSKAEERGWEWVRLGKVVFVDKNPIDPQRHPNTEFWVLTMDNIESNSGRLIKRVVLKGSEIGSTKLRFGPEHVLYGKLRPYLNKVYVPNGEGICSPELVPLKAKENVLREYIGYVLRAPETVEYAKTITTGARQPRVRMKEFLRFKIPMPIKNGKFDINEQKRIVAYLDSISERAQKLVKLYEERQRELENLFPAILDRAFRGEL